MKLAPALAAGNTIVIKPSEHTSASLLEMMPAGRGGRASRRASSTSSPASAPTPAPRWSTTRTSPRWPSPAPAQTGMRDRRAGRRAARPRHARAGRQVAAAGVRRRRPAERRDGHRRGRVRRRRPDLRGGLARVPAGGHLRRGARAGAGAHAADPDRRPARRARPSSARWRSRISSRRCSPTSPIGRDTDGATLLHGGGQPDSRPPPAAGSTSRPSSPTRATTCGSARRRSSARSR